MFYDTYGRQCQRPLCEDDPVDVPAPRASLGVNGNMPVKLYPFAAAMARGEIDFRRGSDDGIRVREPRGSDIEREGESGAGLVNGEEAGNRSE
jgi:hypothetical protein